MHGPEIWMESWWGGPGNDAERLAGNYFMKGPLKPAREFRLYPEGKVQPRMGFKVKVRHMFWESGTKTTPSKIFIWQDINKEERQVK